MREQDLVSDFTAVDQARSPQSFTTWLDRASAMEFFGSVKRQTYGLLELQAGGAVLDVGCGTGDDVRALGQLVGEGGRAVGVDVSETLITEARRRAGGSSLPVEFHQGDALCLPFPDASFDACRSERTLIYLEDPAPALGEMMRVARPGARIVVFEPDLDALMIDGSDRTLTRAIVAHFCRGFPNSQTGRQLPGLFRQAQVVDVAITPVTLVVRDYDVADEFFKLRATVERAQADAAVSVTDAEGWLGEMEQRGRDGRFFVASPAFVVSGRKG